MDIIVVITINIKVVVINHPARINIVIKTVISIDRRIIKVRRVAIGECQFSCVRSLEFDSHKLQFFFANFCAQSHEFKSHKSR